MGDSGCLPRGGHQHGHCQGPQQRVCALACLTTWGTAWPPACLPNTGGPNLRGRGGGRTPILGKRGTVHGGSTMCCMVVSLLCTYDLHYKPHSPLKLASNGQRCPNWTRQGDCVAPWCGTLVGIQTLCPAEKLPRGTDRPHNVPDSQW